MPWRNEKNEVENVDHENIYKKNESIIEINRKPFAIISDEKFDDAYDQVCNDLLEKEKMMDDNDDLTNIEYPVDIFEQGDQKANEIKKNEKPINNYTCPTRISSEKIHEMFENLNNEQREFAMHVLNCFKLDILPLKIYSSGSAGVGKSYLINLLYQLITNYYDNEPGGDLDKMIVVLAAPSGKAAYLIDGMTLHTAFSLPLNQYSGQTPE